MTHSPRRIVFLDVDGTIVGPGNAIDDSTLHAIASARSAGHLVYLCTGRAASDIHPRLREAELDGAITNSGAFGTSRGEQVIRRPMPDHAVRRMQDFFAAEDVHYSLQTDDEIYFSTGMRVLLEEFFRQTLDDPSDAPVDLSLSRDIDGTAIEDVAKAVWFSQAEDTFERAVEVLGPDFHVVRGSIPLAGRSDGEICMAGTTKGSAIELLLAHLGMDAADAVGIGDSWNDVEMFEVVGHAVAMGNAHAELKDLADSVTTDVLDAGVWNAFTDLGLIAER
ncbi:MAG: Cof-type HAD-IIB family hydrolase [Microbacterium sp.]